MLALGLGVIALVVLSGLFRGGLAVAAAAVLTGNVALPSGVDVLVWLAAGGYATLCAIGTVVKLLALANAGSTVKRFR